MILVSQVGGQLPVAVLRIGVVQDLGDSRCGLQRLLRVDRDIDQLGVQAVNLHDSVPSREQVLVRVHLAQQPVDTPLYSGIHLPSKLPIARPLEYLPDRQDELRGLLRVSWIRHRRVGRDLVHDPPVAVRLIRLVAQQAQRLPGQLEVAGRRQRLQRVRLGSEPPRILHEASR